SSLPPAIGASGSCTIRTKLAAPSGTLLHASGGDTSSPACVYLIGIVVPSAHAPVVSVISWTPPRPPPRPPRPPGPGPGPPGAAPRCAPGGGGGGGGIMPGSGVVDADRPSEVEERRDAVDRAACACFHAS